MKKLILISLILFLFCTSQSVVQPVIQTEDSPSKINEHLIWGIPGSDGQLIIREGYALLHDGNKKVPLWVSYHLTKQDLMGMVGRTDDFRPDPKIPTGQRAELSDYYKSGYDRGHMAPAGDMKRSKKVMSESFFLSNMCPQKAALNRYKWKILEEKVRDLTKLKGETWIIVGPVFAVSSFALKKIGIGQVYVPTHFYKIIVIKEGNKVGAFAFLMENKSLEGSLASYATTIDNVELLTNLDFLSVLPDELENSIESKRLNIELLLPGGTPPAVSPAIKQPVEPKSTSYGSYHGNTKSKIFHSPSCRYYNCKNCTRIFSSREEAIRAGYRPCKVCRP